MSTIIVLKKSETFIRLKIILVLTTLGLRGNSCFQPLPEASLFGTRVCSYGVVFMIDGVVKTSIYCVVCPVAILDILHV